MCRPISVSVHSINKATYSTKKYILSFFSFLFFSFFVLIMDFVAFISYHLYAIRGFRNIAVLFRYDVYMMPRIIALYVLLMSVAFSWRSLLLPNLCFNCIPKFLVTPSRTINPKLIGYFFKLCSV
jgi:hypothetical protein